MIPKEALDYIRKKNLIPGFSYQDIWNEEHATSFTVAKAMQMDVLSDIKDAVEEAIENGETFDSFRKSLQPILEKKGWWGKKNVFDPLTGETRKSQLGSTRRLKTIYRTNLRSAYSHGRWQRGQESTAHTHILYLNGPSQNHREQHLSWHGLVLPKDDPFWNTHFPPNGWGCKCYVRFITKRTAERLERDGVATPVRADGTGGGTVPVTTERPRIKYKTFVNKRTGAVEKVPQGIDPGFAWNPGSGRATAVEKAFVEKDRSLANAIRPSNTAGSPVGDHLDVHVRGHRRDAYSRAITAIQSIHGDGPLPSIPVVSSTSRRYHGAFRFYPGGDPVDIRLVGGDHLELTILHEIGHFIDYSGLPGTGFTSLSRTSKEMTAVMELLKQTETFKAIDKLPLRRAQYLRNAPETYARAYSQYIAWKSGNEIMLDQLNKILLSNDPGVRLTQWTHDEFIPVAQAIDELFVRMGWKIRE